VKAKERLNKRADAMNWPEGFCRVAVSTTIMQAEDEYGKDIAELRSMVISLMGAGIDARSNPETWEAIFGAAASLLAKTA
jgi:hypothetical protein